MTRAAPLLLCLCTLLTSLLGPGCKRDSDERLGLDEKRASTPLDPAELARPGELERALGTPAADVAAKLGSWRLTESATLAIGAGEKRDTLDESWKLEVDARGGTHVVVENSHGHGFETVVSGGAVYNRPRYGRFARHVPEGDEVDRARDAVQGVLAGYLGVLGRFADRKDEGDTTVGGRRARRIKLALAGSPGRLRDSDAAHAWRKTMKVSALDGTVDVDVQSGAPLHAVLEATWTAQQPPAAEGGAPVEVSVKLSLRAEVDQLGAVPPIAVPEGPLLPATRTRPLVDRSILLDGLVQPGSATTQAPRSPESPPPPAPHPKT